MRTEPRPARAPGALPLVGHVLPLMRDPLGFVRSLPAHGDLVEVRLGPVRTLVVCTPELTRQVLLDDRTFDKGGPVFGRFREIAGNGLVSCPHADHRRQRRLLQPAFRRTRLPGYATVMAEQFAEGVGSWRDGQVIDVTAAMQMIAGRTGVATMFTGALSATDLARMVDDLNTVLTGIYRRVLLPPPFDRLPTPANRRYDRVRARLRRTLGELIAAYRAHGVDRGDLLSVVLAGRDAPGDGRGLSETEVVDQLVTFFIGGTESTAVTVSWALNLLGRHPDVADRLHEEVDEVLAGARPAFDDLPRLDLTGKIVTETLRLYPPAWMLTRTATADTELGGHAVPAGTPVAFSPYLVHHRADVHPDAERFDPDRWNAGNASPPPRDAVLPFGAGARICIGADFGMTEATIALATIAARWRLEHVSDRPVRPAIGLAMIPKDLRMRVRARVGGQVEVM
ncbi:MAG TPA: cytochrome P450 [Streptosporangiaceae bacterium]|nr:cytochrome P450 [Streptosporangiaceae bacterium]